MTKSKIIKELANETIDTSIALKRTKVLLSELNDEKLINWVNSELTGYSDIENLPSYRKVKGNIIGSYFKGSMMQHMTWTNVSIPLGNMPDDFKEGLLCIYFKEGVESLKQLCEQEGEIGKIVPADLFSSIAYYNNDEYMNITSARVIVGKQNVANIFSAIQNRLLDTLIILEKEFGNLDDLDIELTGKSEEDIQHIKDQINIIIYHDHSITIGNENVLKNSEVATNEKK